MGLLHLSLVWLYTVKSFPCFKLPLAPSFVMNLSFPCLLVHMIYALMAPAHSICPVSLVFHTLNISYVYFVNKLNKVSLFKFQSNGCFSFLHPVDLWLFTLEENVVVLFCWIPKCWLFIYFERQWGFFFSFLIFQYFFTQWSRTKGKTSQKQQDWGSDVFFRGIYSAQELRIESEKASQHTLRKNFYVRQWFALKCNRQKREG